jgi:hypothetical protein
MSGRSSGASNRDVEGRRGRGLQRPQLFLSEEDVLAILRALVRALVMELVASDELASLDHALTLRTEQLLLDPAAARSWTRWKCGDCDEVAVWKRTGIFTSPKVSVAVRASAAACLQDT